MTDQELNRLLAERVLGWKPDEPFDSADGAKLWLKPGTPDQPWVLAGWAIAPVNDDDDDIRYQIGGRRAFDPCNLPDAWGWLYQWLSDNDRRPALWWHQGKHGAMVLKSSPDPSLIDDTKDERDEKPGRALVLAALAAYGVEVNDD